MTSFEFAGGEAEVRTGAGQWPVVVTFIDGSAYPAEIITASFKVHDAIALADAIRAAANKASMPVASDSAASAEGGYPLLEEGR